MKPVVYKIPDSLMWRCAPNRNDVNAPPSCGSGATPELAYWAWQECMFLAANNVRCTDLPASVVN